MTRKKPRQLIGEDLVTEVFSEHQIRQLASIDELPETANLERFGKRVREAARIYALEARTPDDNQVHEEIARLYKAAARSRYVDVADLLYKLSDPARHVLNMRKLGIDLPTPDALRDADRHRSSCQAVARFCSFGGGWTEGRMRPTGRRSRTWEPKIWASTPTRHFSRRKAERSFVTNLKLAHLDACGQLSARTARVTRGREWK